MSCARSRTRRSGVATRLHFLMRKCLPTYAWRASRSSTISGSTVPGSLLCSLSLPQPSSLSCGVRALSRSSRPAAAPRSMSLAMRVRCCRGLIFLALLAPRGPFILYRLLGFAMPLLAGVVATKTFAVPIPRDRLGAGLRGLRQRVSRPRGDGSGHCALLLVLQLLPFGAALLHDWRRGALARFLPHVPAVLLRRLVQAVLLTLAFILGASVLGYAGLARTLSALVVIAPGFALIFAALARVLDQAFAGLLATPLARTLRSVRERGDVDPACAASDRRVVLLGDRCPGLHVGTLGARRSCSPGHLRDATQVLAPAN